MWKFITRQRKFDVYTQTKFKKKFFPKKKLGRSILIFQLKCDELGHNTHLFTQKLSLSNIKEK